jgi:predicted ABC-type ATPase
MSPFSPEAAAFRAGRPTLEEIERYATRGESFGFETILSGRSYLSIPPDQLAAESALLQAETT